MANESIAEVNSVPQAFRGRVLTTGGALMENAAYVGQFVLVIALSLAPAVLCALVATGTIPAPPMFKQFWPIPVGLAISGALAWFLFGWLLANPWTGDFMLKRVQAAFANRPDTLFDCRDTQAILVEVVPRRNWNSLTLQNAEDVGLLQIDTAARLLKFEGDTKRARIPAGSIQECEVELMNEAARHDTRQPPIGLVVIKCRDSMGEREIVFRPIRTVGGEPIGGNSMDKAQWLQGRILSI